MKKLFSTMLLAMSLWGYAQGENNNWYFGYQIAINFSGSTPQFVNGSDMTSLNSSATVSDSGGKLLFYSSGGKVWNRQNQEMPNGDIDQDGLQTATVKHPTNPNLYYIFTTTWVAGNVVRYSVVDMSLGSNGSNGQPLGDVVQNQKKVPLLDGQGNEISNARGVTVVPHGDGSSYWVLVTNGLKLYAYRLSGSGLSTTPVVTDLNTSGFFTSYDGISIKASPEVGDSCNYSHLLCITNSNPSLKENEGMVRSFDNLSGSLTTDYNLSIASTSATYAEFNQYANILYVSGYDLTSNTTTFYAIDLPNSNNSNIVYTPIYNGMSGTNGVGGPSTIQRNTKGDIYFHMVGYNNGGSLSQIINPDVYGQSSINLNAMTQPSAFIYVGSTNNLPQLLPKLSRRVGSCVASYDLTAPDTHTAPYTYHASSTITAQQNYQVNSTQDITMKAGTSISLLPDTYIQNGSNYLAKIEDCKCSGGEVEARNKNSKNNMLLNLRTAPKAQTDKKDLFAKKVQLFPNPASDVLNIITSSEIINVSVTDISGRMIQVKLDGNKVDIRSLPSGNYLINIETKEGKTSQRFVKK
ncbi:T9SS type A sorting domain-containing protein [Chryseobacterium pennipullorum]|uniref:Secretion system C-terminal sorting domain-containing protein n=1 Tax=Chryseobacterium pennipullorum TaxID=2258963 RepID=A0A3D9B8Q3_9FLAO|nr:T9SS type A sorting domain-containing protein [Chryseobacterium pennipullorum]REC50041.1 hypothetical protein DRF67_00400 [Chryseobacterium pennipullorum]